MTPPITTTSCPAADVCARLDRRTLLANAAFAAAAAVLAACGVSDPSAPDAVTLTINLGDYPQLAATGGVALISAGGSPIAVVRTSETAFLALSRICPHQGSTIGTSATGFECPRHHARFTSSGSWTGGERTSNMRSYPATYDATANTVTIG